MGLNQSSSKSAKLYDDKGNFLRKLKLPLTAAELMLEEQPGHVICPVDELLRTGRFTALRAEDVLIARRSYLAVPFCKVNHKVSESDMKFIKLGCCNKNKKKRSLIQSKVVPEMVEESTIEEQKVVVEGKIKDMGFVQLNGYRRGWTPVLESIAEDPRRRRLVQHRPRRYRTSEEFSIRKIKFKAFDLGGHQIARRVWQDYYAKVDAVVYLVAAYNEFNLLKSSMELDALLSDEALADVPFLILGNRFYEQYNASEVRCQELYLQLFLNLPITIGKGKVNLAGSNVRPLEVFMCCFVDKPGYGEGFKWLSQYIK